MKLTSERDMNHNLKCSSKDQRWQESLMLNLHFRQVNGARSTMDNIVSSDVFTKRPLVSRRVVEQERNFEIEK